MAGSKVWRVLRLYAGAETVWKLIWGTVLARKTFRSVGKYCSPEWR